MSKTTTFGARPKRAEVTNPAAADAWVGKGTETPPAPAPVDAEKLKPKRLTIDIEPSLHKRLKTKAAAEETTIADVVRSFLEEWASR